MLVGELNRYRSRKSNRAWPAILYTYVRYFYACVLYFTGKNTDFQSPALADDWAGSSRGIHPVMVPIDIQIII